VQPEPSHHRRNLQQQKYPLRNRREPLDHGASVPANAPLIRIHSSLFSSAINSSIALFHFQLWPIEQIAPWNQEGRKVLHWFALTDGSYGIDCGGTELLRTNQHIINATPHYNWRTPFFDYQVSRFYEDLLELLPAAIDPLPSDITDLIRTRDAAEQFEDLCDAWTDQCWPDLPYPNTPTPDQLADSNRCSDFWDLAAGWWNNKGLPRGHCRGQPDIEIFTEDDTTTIRWTNDCDQDTETGLIWNEVADGEFQLPRAEFLAEVERFHTNFMAAMNERARAARAHWPHHDVAIDLDELEREQEARLHSLADALALVPKQRPDWNQVRQAIQYMRRQLDE